MSIIQSLFNLMLQAFLSFCVMKSINTQKNQLIENQNFLFIFKHMKLNCFKWLPDVSNRRFISGSSTNPTCCHKTYFLRH